MTQDEFREWVRDSISDQAKVTGFTFSISQSYPDYLSSFRSILVILDREVKAYRSDYDFNLQKARYYPL